MNSGPHEEEIRKNLRIRKFFVIVLSMCLSPLTILTTFENNKKITNS